MPKDTSPYPSLRSFTIDRVTVIFVLLVVAVQAAAIASSGYLARVERGPTSQHTDVELGVVFVGIVVFESLLVVLAWSVWKRVSVDARRTIVRVAGGSMVLVCLDLFCVSLAILHREGVLLGAAATTAAIGAVLAVLALCCHRVLARGLFWILFNVAGLAIGIVIVAMFGSAVAPVVILPIMVVSLGWDYIAVKLSGVMDGVIAVSSAASIPNHLVIPRRVRVEWDDVTVWLADMEGQEKPASVDGVIGVGDLVVPGIFTVSLWVGGAELVALWAMLGTVLAMIVLRDMMTRTTEGVPGLPWLNTGALGGFIAGVAITGTPILTALGI